MKLIERYASQDEKDWLWSLYKYSLQEYIEAEWGWDEDFQYKMFEEKLPIASFVIVSNGSLNQTDVAAYFVSSHTDYYYIKMILVEETHQHKGIGRYILTKLQEQAKIAGKSIKLSVIRTNPVIDFYTKHGFTIDKECDGSIYMQWHPSRS